MKSTPLLTYVCLLGILAACQPVTTPTGQTDASASPQAAAADLPARGADGGSQARPGPSSSAPAATATPGPGAAGTPAPVSTVVTGPVTASVPANLARIELKTVSTELTGIDTNEAVQIKGFDADGHPVELGAVALEWTSSRPQDVMVDAQGHIKALTDFGYSLISAKLKGTSFSAQLQIAVNTYTIGSAAAAQTIPPPVVQSLAPTSGIPGTTLIIKGTGFASVIGSKPLVRFGNTLAEITESSTDSLTVIVPPGLSGNQRVTVTVNSQVSLEAAFAVRPSVTSLSAGQGTAGTSLTITGTGFDPVAGNNTVKFGSVSVVPTAASATSLTVTVPETIAGSKNVTVTVGSQTSSETRNYNLLPGITSLSASAIVGSSLTITGTGFDPTLANNQVSFGGTPATVTGATASTLTVTIPAGVSGAQTVTASVNGQTSAGATYNVKPAIGSLGANQGAAGTSLVISGSGFSTTLASNSVLFDTTPALVTAATPTSLTVTVPVMAVGSKNVTVTVGGQVNTGTHNYTILPNITGFSAPAIIGTNITITGTGFDATPGNNQVLFGTTSATVTAATTSSLTVTIPAGVSGTQSVTNTVSSLSTAAANYAIKPSITSVAPSQGVTTTSVTITGSGFSDIAANDTVMIGSNAATVTGTPTNTSLTATVNGSSLDYGTKDVTVGVGTQTSDPGSFTQHMTIPCRVSGFTPTAGDPLFFYDCLDGAPTGTNGTDYNNIAQVSDRFGQPNKAYSFNGTNSFRQFSGIGIGPAARPQLTMSVWTRVTTVPMSGVYSIIGQDDTPFDRAIVLDNRSAGSVFGWSAFAGPSGGVIGASPPVANQWVMLTAVYNQATSTVALYVDGTLFTSKTGAALGEGTSYLMLGKNAKVGVNEFFPGEIDDVLVFNKALSAADVAELYLRTKP